jgi:hypothetical protein
MLNGYVMLTELEAENQIYLPQALARIARAKEATLEHIGNALEGRKGVAAESGDRVLVHPNKLTEYQIGGKKFSITRQEHLFCRVMA